MHGRKKLTLENFMQGLARRNPRQFEFHQAVEEVAASVIPYILQHPEYMKARILERMAEPDRTIIFRVVWEDDQGGIHVNRGYRVQFNNAIGPYKGGLRFHPTVNLSILKFLGFEQTFKNSLTTLPMGAAKGGANFNPKGKSDREVMRFCQSFMTELHRYIGPNVDIPAGDLGVGTREISYMFGQYKRLENEFTGVITGKALEYGGSFVRREATGYGCAYFMQQMLHQKGDSVEGKTCIVSGAGNVAQHTAEKLIELGGKVIAMSDTSGFIHDPEGIDQEKLNFIMDLKNRKRASIAEYAEKFKSQYYPNQKPWSVPCDLAFPCATQNEIDECAAQELVKNGCIGVAEGANMPTLKEGVNVFQNARILYAPGKASNAGGVAVSGLEMTQNIMRLNWNRDELEARLKDIMRQIHQKCLYYGQEEDGRIDYVRGANIAGFKKVADAMLAYGTI